MSYEGFRVGPSQNPDDPCNRGSNMRQPRRGATAIDSTSWKIYSRKRYLLALQLKPVYSNSAPLYSCRVLLLLLNVYTPAASQRLKHAPAPPRSYSQRLGFFEGTSPRGLPCRFTLLRSASTELSFSCCGSVAAPRAEALAP